MAACRTMKQHRAGVDSCETIFLVLYNKKAKPRKRRTRDRQGQRRERKKREKGKRKKGDKRWSATRWGGAGFSIDNQWSASAGLKVQWREIDLDSRYWLSQSDLVQGTPGTAAVFAMQSRRPCVVATDERGPRTRHTSSSFERPASLCRSTTHGYVRLFRYADDPAERPTSTRNILGSPTSTETEKSGKLLSSSILNRFIYVCFCVFVYIYMSGKCLFKLSIYCEIVRSTKPSREFCRILIQYGCRRWEIKKFLSFRRINFLNSFLEW